MELFDNTRNTPKRMAMVVHAYYLKDARVRRYAEALVEDEWEVDVFCLRDRGETPRQICQGVNIIRVPYTRVRGGKLADIVEYTVSQFLLGLYVSVFQFTRRYSIVHVHTPPDTLVLTALLPRTFGAKTILDYHDLMAELFMAKYKAGSGNWLTKLLRVVERYSARFADVVLTACSTFRINLVMRSIPEQKVHVIRNLPDPRLFQQRRGCFAPDSQHFTLLYLGTLSERYGVDIPIKALTELRVTIPHVRLRIVGKITGEGRTKDALKELAFSRGVSDIVEFIQPVALDNVAEVIATSDVGVYTPIRDAHMDYAFSLKVGEFAALGVPMVATKTPVMEEYVGHDGAAYIESGDVNGFVRQVIRLYADKQCRASILRASERFTAQNSWEEEKRRYIEIVERLIDIQPRANIHAVVRSSAKRTARSLLATSHRCTTSLLGNASARRDKCVRVLVYHDIRPDPDNDFVVSPDDFKKQMEFLHDHHPLVSLDVVRKWLDGDAALDDGAIAITFDDGLNGVYKYAAPCMERYGIPGAVFIVEQFTSIGRSWTGARTLSLAQIQDIAKCGFLIGSHGRSHVSLAASHLNNGRLTAEVAGSKLGLERLLNLPIRYFAYPYGTAKDFDPSVVAAVKAAGYDLAFTAVHGRNDRSADPFALRRLKVERTDSLSTFRAVLDGGMDAWGWIDTHATLLQSRRRTLSTQLERVQGRT